MRRAECRLAVAPEVIQKHAPAEHQVRKSAPPCAVVVREAVDEDEGIAAPNLGIGNLHVVDADAHRLAASSRSDFRFTLPGPESGSSSTRCTTSGHL